MSWRLRRRRGLALPTVGAAAVLPAGEPAARRPGRAALTWTDGRRRAGTALGLALVLAIPVILGAGNYLQYIVNITGIYAIVSLALNLLVGWAGQISIGHSAFLAFGAYASALITLRLSWSFWIALPLAGLVAAAVGYVFGLPAVRLQGHYLALVTLGFAAVVPELLIKWSPLTNGWSGLHPPHPSLLGLPLNTDARYYYLIVAFLIAVLWVSGNLLRSRTGRAFAAVRDSELAAVAMGIDVAGVKVRAFAISAFFTGIAGSLYAHLVGYISPDNFSLNLSFVFLAMIAVGGIGSLPGAIVGAAVLTWIPQMTANLKSLSSVVTGGVMALSLVLFPRGVVEVVRPIFGGWRAEAHPRHDQEV